MIFLTKRWAFFLILWGTTCAVAQTESSYFSHKTDDLGVPAHCLPLELEDFDLLPTEEDPRKAPRLNTEPLNHQILLVSIEGARRAGFTHEVAMHRSHADILQAVFRHYFAQGPSIPDLTREIVEDSHALATLLAPVKRDIAKVLNQKLAGSTLDPFAKRVLRRHTARMAERFLIRDIDFAVVGEVLEVLLPYAVDRKGQAIQSKYPENDYFITGGVEYRYKAGGNTVGEIDLLIGQDDDCKIVATGEAKLGLRQLEKAKKQVRRFYRFLQTVRARHARSDQT